MCMSLISRHMTIDYKDQNKNIAFSFILSSPECEMHTIIRRYRDGGKVNVISFVVNDMDSAEEDVIDFIDANIPLFWGQLLGSRTKGIITKSQDY